MNSDKNAARYYDFKPGSVIRKLIYSEYWYFDVHDADGFEFFINCSINNPWDAKLLGFKIKGLGRSTDIIIGIATSDKKIRRVDDNTFLDYFKAPKGVFDLNLGQQVFIKGNESEIHLNGNNKKVNTEFDLHYTRLSSPWRIQRLRLGKKKKNSICYFPFMPLAKVVGKVSLDGIEYDIDGLGYSDHLWGSSMAYCWAPWYMVYDDDFMIICSVSHESVNFGTCGVYYRGEWLDFGKPEIEISKTKVLNNLEYPVAFSSKVSSNEYSLELSIREIGDPFLLDLGTKKKSAPLVRSMNYITNGILEKDGKAIKKIKNLKTTFDWSSLLKYMDFLI